MIYKPYGQCLTKRNPDKTQQQKKKKNAQETSAKSDSKFHLESTSGESCVGI